MSIKIAIAAFIVIACAALFFFSTKSPSTPLVAIVSYGPHPSLDATVKGLKDGLLTAGYEEGKNIRFSYDDVSFDTALIPQMLAKAQAQRPTVLATLTTPITQQAKAANMPIPLVFAAITDPVAAGLIPSKKEAGPLITGASEQQDLRTFLHFAKILLPHASRVGLLYATGESNDAALLKMMQDATQDESMQLVAIAVEHARDISTRTAAFKDKVDFVYVGTSGPIQPSLPSIVAQCDQLMIPVFNADDSAVKDGLALGSFGVSYEQVGKNAAKLVAKLLNGEDIAELAPIYPSLEDHHAFVNRAKAKQLGIALPENLQNTSYIGDGYASH